MTTQPLHRHSIPQTQSRLFCALLMAGTALFSAPTQALADDQSWNPFASDANTYRPPRKRTKPRTEPNPAGPRDPLADQQGTTGAGRYGADPFPGSTPRYARPPVPGGRYDQPFGGQRETSTVSPVESGKLAPVVSEKSGLPFATWQGLSVKEVERLLVPLELPLRSAALQQLWLQLFSAEEGGSRDKRLVALRAEALFRSGHLDEAAAVVAAGRSGGGDANILVLSARIEIARGNISEGCGLAKQAGGQRSKTIKALRGEAVVLAGYCAIVAGKKAGAGLAAELARNEGYRSRFTLAILDAIASGRTSRKRLPKKITVLQFLLLQHAGFAQPQRLIAKASPALLAVLQRNRSVPADVRLLAAEKAAQRNVIQGLQLANTYRDYRPTRTDKPPGAEARRARLFQDAQANPTPLQRTRTIRALVDDARRAKLTFPMLIAVKPMIDEIRPAPEISWFAATAIESMLAAGDYDGVLPWLALAGASDRVYGESIQHWRVLADIANPATAGRKIDLYSLEDLVRRGRLAGSNLRRLTTVLNALGYNVPIPVWDAANRAPKSKTGKLPPTGVLSQLLNASKANEAAKAALLAMRGIGNFSAETAHLIPLGDAIKGLQRAGFGTAAKRLAFEAVFAAWPRPS